MKYKIIMRTIYIVTFDKMKTVDLNLRIHFRPQIIKQEMKIKH